MQFYKQSEHMCEEVRTFSVVLTNSRLVSGVRLGFKVWVGTGFRLGLESGLESGLWGELGWLGSGFVGWVITIHL